jgi:hypothetical protein
MATMIAIGLHTISIIILSAFGFRLSRFIGPLVEYAEAGASVDLDVKIHVRRRESIDLHDRSVSDRFEDILKLARHPSLLSMSSSKKHYIRAPSKENSRRPFCYVPPR